MCEMRVMRPDVKLGIEVTEKMWRRGNKDGVGIVAAYKNDKGFDYTFYKSIWYVRRRLKRWLRKNTEAWRWFIHCRNATSGGISIASTHPILSECPKCSISMLMHNGIMMFLNEEEIKAKLMAKGHVFTGEVDSEMILHLLKHIPKSLEAVKKRDWFNDEGWTNWIAFNKRGILIHNDGDYKIDSKKILMKKRPMMEQWKKAVKYLLLFPSGRKEVSYRKAERWGGYGYEYNDNWGWRTKRQQLPMGFTEPVFTQPGSASIESRVERKARQQGESSLTEGEWIEYMYQTGELTYHDYIELMKEVRHDYA